MVNPSVKFFTFFCKSIPNGLKRMKNMKQPTAVIGGSDFYLQRMLVQATLLNLYPILSINVAWVK